jgi:hypothetical protein
MWGSVAPPSLTFILDGVDWPASRPRPFTHGEKAPGTHLIEGWVGPRAGLEIVKKNPLPLPGIEPWPSSPLPFAAPTELPWLQRLT